MEFWAPQSWQDFVGNKRAIKLLKTAFSTGIRSIILYGPVGVGKTTAATLLAKESGSLYFHMDGSRFSKSELDKILRFNNVVLFIDEISRLNKTAQHSLLIPIGEGRMTLIGASWENPWKMLIPPLRSRSVLIKFEKPSDDDMKVFLDKVAHARGIEIPDDVKEFIVRSSGGDFRRLQVLLHLWQETGEIDDSIGGSGVADKDEFYDVMSAMIKSIRGSDPDAGVYYLMRFIEGGGSPEYVARRLVILASEDIGNADPRALQIATSAMYAVEKIGLPEALYFLVQTAVYLATAYKSNSVLLTIKKAKEVVEKYGDVPVPQHLKNYKGSGYVYPHSHGGWVPQKYLPAGVDEYLPIAIFKNGYEKKMLSRLENIRKDPESSGQVPHQDD